MGRSVDFKLFRTRVQYSQGPRSAFIGEAQAIRNYARRSQISIEIDHPEGRIFGDGSRGRGFDDVRSGGQPEHGIAVNRPWTAVDQRRSLPGYADPVMRFNHHPRSVLFRLVDAGSG